MHEDHSNFFCLQFRLTENSVLENLSAIESSLKIAHKLIPLWINCVSFELNSVDHQSSDFSYKIFAIKFFRLILVLVFKSVKKLSVSHAFISILICNFFDSVLVFATIFTAKIPICIEGWPLPWWHSNGKDRQFECFTRCSWSIKWFWIGGHTMLLHIGTIHWCQIRCSCAKNRQQLQGIHVSKFNWAFEWKELQWTDMFNFDFSAYTIL